jgi:hypothetical protein
MISVLLSRSIPARGMSMKLERYYNIMCESHLVCTSRQLYMLAVNTPDRI